jgi:formylglycine-generating enzyme required for sulfatase activity
VRCWEIGLLVIVAACSDDYGADPATPGIDSGPGDDSAASTDSATGGDTGSSDAATDAVDTGPCPTDKPGPKMVRVVHDTASFCIDSTEVTRGQYKAFLDSAPDPTKQPAQCLVNTAFTPDREWPFAPTDVTKPVVGTNWCDARAYCAYAGKRLCGRVGGGATLDFAEVIDPSKSEWFIACSHGGQRAYPYGGSFVDAACSEKQIDPVGTHVQCQGGYDGIFDMSGNAHEWVDACNGNTSGDDLCAITGSGYIHPANEMACAYFFYGPRKASEFDPVNGSETGFRCCL